MDTEIAMSEHLASVSGARRCGPACDSSDGANDLRAWLWSLCQLVITPGQKQHIPPRHEVSTCNNVVHCTHGIVLDGHMYICLACGEIEGCNRT